MLKGNFFVLDNTSLVFGFFCDVNQNLKARRFLSEPLRKQKFTSTDSKGHGLRFVIGEFRYVLRVSVVSFKVCCF